ncbi:hypothetical protein L484_003224 [Morus notabilis]|uniref:Uncharacterized protein n=1 Tax=Morus notabilis TaxID=981085 RepID=W9R217_9ROSA|nr:hypothetical protein L484_003224 [Morus notabilis]
MSGRDFQLWEQPFTKSRNSVTKLTRKRSCLGLFGERSLSELSFSPLHSSRNADINFSWHVDHVESVYSSGRRTGSDQSCSNCQHTTELETYQTLLKDIN